MLIAAIVTAVLAGTLILLNETKGIFSQDHFPNPATKWAAYAWLTLLIFVMSSLVVSSSQESGAPDLSQVAFWQLFVLHMLLLLFLAGWWVLSGQPRLSSYMNIQGDRLLEQVAIGGVVGVGGWLITIGLAVLIGLALTAGGVMPENMQPSPMIPWMAGLAWWKKGLIVLSAMTVEEFFFRGWLQKRVGLVGSTIVFAIAHAGYGQPFMLIGITIISLVIGLTFYYTRRLIPCIIAHGMFDAIQIFVIIPVAINMMPK